MNYRVRTIHLELTNFCNLKCVMCATLQMERPKKELSFDLIKKIVNENPQVSAFGLTNWGEPLLHSQFFDIVSFLKQHNKEVRFCTNATLLNGITILRLVHSGVDQINFSLDGINEVYEQIRNYPYKEVKQNIMNLLSFEKKAEKKIRHRIAATVFDVNESHLEDLKKDWKGILKVVPQPMLTFKRKVEHKKCHQLFDDHLVVLSDGSVVPCCVDYDANLVVGDAKTQTLNEIINSKKMEALRINNVDSFCNYCSEYKTMKAARRFKTHPFLRKTSTFLKTKFF